MQNFELKIAKVFQSYYPQNPWAGASVPLFAPPSTNYPGFASATWHTTPSHSVTPPKLKFWIKAWLVLKQKFGLVALHRPLALQVHTIPMRKIP